MPRDASEPFLRFAIIGGCFSVSQGCGKIINLDCWHNWDYALHVYYASG